MIVTTAVVAAGLKGATAGAAVQDVLVDVATALERTATANGAIVTTTNGAKGAATIGETTAVTIAGMTAGVESPATSAVITEATTAEPAVDSTPNAVAHSATA